jgi:hypothetical protein
MDKKAPERSGASGRLKGYIRTFIDLSSRLTSGASERIRGEGRRFGQQPRQMVFSFVSNFEFSAAMSTTCPCSGAVSDAAGLAGPGRVLDVAGLAAAIDGAALS